MANDNIEIKLNINTSGAQKSLEGFKNSANSSFTGLNNSLKNVESQSRRTQDALQKAIKINTKPAVTSIDALKGSFGGLGSILSSVKGAGAIGAVVAGATALASGFSAAIEESVKLENSLTGLKTIAKATGNDLEAVTAVAKELSKDGLASVADISTSLKNLLSKGFSLDEATKLLKITKDTAAFGRQEALSYGDAIRSVTEGIKNENSVLTDNGGITTNLSIMYKEFAATLNKTVESLSAAEKRQAILNGFQKEGGKTAGDAAKLLETYSGQVTKLSSSYDRLLQNIGNFITQSSLVKGTIGFLSEGIDNLNFASLSASEKLKVLTKDLAEFDKKNQMNFNNKSDKAALQAEVDSLTKIVELESLRGEEAKYLAKLKRESIEKEAMAAENAAKAAKESAEQQKADLKILNNLKKKYSLGGGLDEIGKLKAQRDAELDIAKNSFDLKFEILKEYDKKVGELNEKQKKQQIADANELAKLNEKIGKDALLNAASNPFGKAVTPEGLTKEQEETFKRNSSLGQGAGFANAVAGGKEGARGLVTGAAALAIDAFAPGLGQALTPLLSSLTQGPDAVKSMVKEFTGALPELIQALVESAPVLIEELANQTPVVIQRLAERAPEIIQALIKNFPSLIAAVSLQMPKLAVTFIESLVKEAPKFVNGLVASIGKAVKEFLGLGSDGKGITGTGGGKGLGGALSTGPTKSGILNTGLNIVTLGGSGIASSAGNKLKDFLGFARGGEIPSGFPNDTLPAKLSSGELVIDRSTNSDLKDFLKSNQGGSVSEALLIKIVSLLEQPIKATAVAQVNQREFANIMLQLNRTQQRTS